MPFRPLPDLERNKFIEIDDDASAVRVSQVDGSEVSLEESFLLLNALENILSEQKLTNLYLSQIIGENLGDNCG